MGFFDSGNDDTTTSPGNDAVNQQIAQNEKELEEKRQSLYTQRLDVIKSQGGQNWGTPNVSQPPASSPRVVYGKQSDLLGKFGDSILTTAIGQARTGIAGKQPTIS